MFWLSNTKKIALLFGGLIINLVMEIKAWPRTSFKYMPLLDMGMDGIFTDFPNSMKFALEARYNVNYTLFET